MAFTFQNNQSEKFLHDSYLLKKADQYKPALHYAVVNPTGIVNLQEDHMKLMGWGTQKVSLSINELSRHPMQKGDQIILDFGTHIVGHLHLSLDTVGSPMDAPLHLKLRFAEVPAELVFKTEDYHGWLSSSWIQEDVIHLDELPAELNPDRRYSFRYVEITVLDTSPKWQLIIRNAYAVSESSCNQAGFKPMHFEGVDHGIKLEVVFGFLKNEYNEKIISFANGVRTGDGGYHVTGLKKALTSIYNTYASNHGLTKNNQSLDGDCLREGLVAILSCWVPEHLLQFEGQTKGKLGTKEALNSVDSVIENKLAYYLEEHKDEAEAVVKKTVEEMRIRDKTEADRKKERELVNNKMSGVEISKKLTPCSSKDYMANELFIVEGDSAGGSAKKGRNPQHQAILPLRGKPKNTTDVEDEKALLGNLEIATLISTIGAGFNNDFNIKNIHYGKVIIMTDADDDGSHIQSLLLTFFYNHMKPLIETGHLYIACPPLYRVYNGKGKEIYCYDDTELAEAQKKIGSGYKVNRYKGLGEMNYTQLSATTMDPEHRKLLKVLIVDDEDAHDKVNIFLGKDSDRRKDWIENNIDFNTTDTFTTEVVRNEK